MKLMYQKTSPMRGIQKFINAIPRRVKYMKKNLALSLCVPKIDKKNNVQLRIRKLFFIRFSITKYKIRTSLTFV